jgi:hypothetical protein
LLPLASAATGTATSPALAIASITRLNFMFGPSDSCNQEIISGETVPRCNMLCNCYYAQMPNLFLTSFILSRMQGVSPNHDSLACRRLRLLRHQALDAIRSSHVASGTSKAIGA